MPTLLITGANRGLGLEFVRQYAADGWDIIACCRQPEKADKLQAFANKHKTVRIEVLDVADFDAITKLANRLDDTAVDLLINNAGVISDGNPAYSRENRASNQNFGSIDAEVWSHVLKINTIAPIMILQAFMPHLLQSTERKLINITSKMGSITEMGQGYIAYRTSKAALNAAMINIAPELVAQKIAWANLHPGWVQTDMGGPQADITVETSIAGMRKVIAKLTLQNSGKFFGYDEKIIPW